MCIRDRRFFDYLDREAQGHPVLINMIVPGNSPDWIWRRSDGGSVRMPGFERELPGETKFFEYIGVPWLFEQRELLCRLLRGESIPVEGSPFEGRCYTSDEPGWNYVETPGEAEYLLKEVCGFHDSLLRELSYVSGAHANEDGTVCPVDDIRRVTMEFDCQWSPGVELVFEGVTALNLRPAEDNYMSDLYGVSPVSYTHLDVYKRQDILLRGLAVRAHVCDHGRHHQPVRNFTISDGVRCKNLLDFHLKSSCLI